MPLMHQFLFEKADWYEACLARRAHELGYSYIPQSVAQLMRNMTVGTPMRIALLAQRIGVTRRRVSQVAAEGVKLDVLELVEDPDDKRVLLVQMSPAGQQMADATIASMHRVEAELARRIGRTKLETLVELLGMDWGPAEVHDTATARVSASALPPKTLKTRKTPQTPKTPKRAAPKSTRQRAAPLPKAP